MVADLVLPSGETSELGIQLADQLSSGIAAFPEAPEVIERSKLRQYLATERIPGKLLNNDKAMRWLGRELGATAILVGRTHLQGANLQVEMRLLACDKNKAGPPESLTLPGGSSSGRLQPVESFPKDPPVTKSGSPQEIPRLDTKNGITAPTCIYCPSPSYSADARKERLQGIILLEVVVNSNGEPESATILRGQPLGLNGVATSIIREKWKFNPATRDGKPVRVKAAIEMNFQLH